jgi:DNA-binding CsgD family transcriptional regulator
VLVGRGRELSVLADCLAENRPVVVVGEAGVGKTAVLRAAAAATGQRVFEGGGLSTLSWMECLPLRRAVGDSLKAADAPAVATQVQRAVRNGILLLDDLHWSDALTVAAAALLTGHCRVLTAVRRGDPHAHRVLDQLAGAGFERVDLAPLREEDSASLVRELRPDLTETAVSRLVHRTGGNPLLLRELTRTPHPSPSLRLLLAARLRLLSQAGHDAFGLLALAGRPLPPDVLGERAGAELVDADLAAELPSGLAPRHALLAEVAVDLLEPERRRELHSRLARLSQAPGEAARHYAQAGEAELALEAAVQAADATARPGERASHLALAASVATGPAADELRLRAARALDEAHDWAGVVTVLGTISGEDSELRAWSQLLLARGAWAAGDVDALRAAITEGLALASGTGSEVEVKLRIEQSRLPIFVDCDLAEGVAMTTAAFDLARASGIDEPRAEYLLGTALAVADEPGGGEHLRSAVRAAREAGDVHTEFVAANNLISHHESVGPQLLAREVAEEMIGRAAALGLGYWESAMRATVVNLDAHAGAYERVVTAAAELLDQPLEARTRDMLVECLGLALTDLGRVDEANRRLTAEQGKASPDYRGQGQLLWVLAEAALWGGRPQRALDLLAEYLSGPSDDPNRWLGLVTRAWALTEIGQHPGAPVPPHERPMLLGARPETQALLLLHLGRYAAAAGMFDRAATLWAPFHRRAEIRCAWAAGEALRLGGDRPGAIERLEAAEAAASELSAALFLARIQRSLRAAGQRRSARRSERRAGLTDRERQVLELVAAGLTNAQIATRLGITQRTVIALVASASAELGAANRSHAAALAARR